MVGEVFLSLYSTISLALAQKEIKRSLASLFYNVSIGYMMLAALGIGSYRAALYFIGLLMRKL